MWDMRHHRARCIKTFGLSGSGVGTGAEFAIQDLQVSPSGNTLFSTSGNVINIWDLRKYVGTMYIDIVGCRGVMPW